MLILSIIVMCSDLYSVCLISRVLKDIYFKEQNIVQQGSTKKGIWKFIFPWKKVYWHVLQIAKTHFKQDLVHGFWKKVLCDTRHGSSQCWYMHVPKVASNKTCKRHYVPEFPEFQPLDITLVV